ARRALPSRDRAPAAPGRARRLAPRPRAGLAPRARRVRRAPGDRPARRRDRRGRLHQPAARARRAAPQPRPAFRADPGQREPGPPHRPPRPRRGARGRRGDAVRRDARPVPRRAVPVPHPRPAHPGRSVVVTTTATVPCSEPGCPGTIEDGYCNVCGSPAGGSGAAPTGTATGASATGAPAPGSAAAASPSAMLGTGFVEGRPGTAPGSADPDGERSTRTGRTSSSRLASTARGSARTAATGSKATRRVGTSSTRLRGRGLGAGLTTVPSVPVRDPLQSVMAVPEVAERKRFCPACGEKVGRGRDGQPGRTSGFCPHCGTRFDFTPQLKPGDLVGGQYEVVGCLAHGGLGWIYLA